MKQHPELYSEECFIGNMTIEEFGNCSWETKRKGNFCFNEYFKVFYCNKKGEEVFPVFVRKDELAQKNIPRRHIMSLTGPREVCGLCE